MRVLVSATPRSRAARRPTVRRDGAPVGADRVRSRRRPVVEPRPDLPHPRRARAARRAAAPGRPRARRPLPVAAWIRTAARTARGWCKARSAVPRRRSGSPTTGSRCWSPTGVASTDADPAWDREMKFDFTTRARGPGRRAARGGRAVPVPRPDAGRDPRLVRSAATSSAMAVLRRPGRVPRRRGRRAGDRPAPLRHATTRSGTSDIPTSAPRSTSGTRSSPTRRGSSVRCC